MQQQEQVVPAMRFSGFKEDWKCQFLESTSSLKGGFAFPSSEMSSFEQDYQLIKMSNLYSGVLDLSRNPSYWSHLEPNHEGYLIKDGDILITLTGTFGKKDFGYTVLMQNPKNLLLNQRVALIRPKKGCSPNFLANLFKTSKFDREFHRLAIGGTGNQANVSINDCRKIRLLIPSNEEQQKIAAFLGAVDEKIAQLQKKKNLLEYYKKGCMQKLFSQEIRFTDDCGNAFSDWEQYAIDKVFKHNKGYGLSKGAIVENGQYPCVLYGELYTTYQEKIELVQSYTNQDDGKESEKDDLLVPSSTTTSGIDLANITVLRHEGVKLGGDITIMRPKKPINALFYAYYLTHFKKHEIAKYAQGITIVHLYFNHFKKIKIDYPHPDEQKKIADFLSAIDDKIALVAEELDKAKTFKKGLLQQMFV